MKKVVLLSLGLLLIASCEQDNIMPENEGINVVQSSLTRGAKVDVCHNGRIKNVSVNALGGHQGHGDAVDMDGDGYFDKENDCGDIDCDDTNAEVNETCGASIGDLRDGGIVFWVDPTDNTHGLVCALSDYASMVEWGCHRTDLPSVPDVPEEGGYPAFGDGAEIGDGATNTIGILTDCTTAPAALAARSLGPEWFLPSIKELNEMYVNRATLEAVPGFTPFQRIEYPHYYSSSEYDSGMAWAFIFRYSTATQYPVRKSAAYFVRAVRAF